MGKKSFYSVLIKRTLLLGTLLAVMVLAKQNVYAAAGSTQSVSQVTGLKQTSDGSNSVGVEWNAVLGSNIRYEVFVSTSENGTYIKESSDAYSPRDYISNLSAGSTYYVKVRAYEYAYNTPNVYGAYSSICKVVTTPTGNISTIKQTNATEITITLQWSKVAGANQYYITYYKYGDSANKKTVASNTNSITLKNLSKNGRYSVGITAARNSGTYVAKGYTCYMSSYVNTVPTKVTGIKCTTFYTSLNTTYFTWKENASAQGYQYIVYSYDGKKLFSGSTTSYSFISIKNSKLVANKFYKIKVRGYINVGSSKKYGKWSSDQYFTGDNSSVKLSKSSGKLKTTWKKCSGATSYSVYVSTSRPNDLKDMKKVATVSSSKLSYTLTKFNGSKISTKKTYYVYVCANRKVGSVTYTAIPQSYMYK